MGGLHAARVVFQLLRLGNLLEQVIEQVGVDQLAHAVVPGLQHVGGLRGVVLLVLCVLGRLPAGVAAQHAPGDILQQTADGRGQSLPRADCALVVALGELGLGQLLDQHTHFILPEGALEVADARQAQHKLVQQVLQQRRGRLHAVGLCEGMAIVVDGLRVFEGLDLGVQLVVDQNIEEGVRLGGGERLARH